VRAGAADMFEVNLWSTALVFNAGHRIRVSATSSNYLRFADQRATIV